MAYDYYTARIHDLEGRLSAAQHRIEELEAEADQRYAQVEEMLEGWRYDAPQTWAEADELWQELKVVRPEPPAYIPRACDNCKVSIHIGTASENVIYCPLHHAHIPERDYSKAVNCIQYERKGR